MLKWFKSLAQSPVQSLELDQEELKPLEKSPSCYKKEQAQVIAQWWLTIIKDYMPHIIAERNSSEDKPLELTAEQCTGFVETLTDSIWNESEKDDFQIKGYYFRIDSNGQNWHLVKAAMDKHSIVLRDHEKIYNIMSTMQQDGKISFSPCNKHEFYDISDPDESLLNPMPEIRFSRKIR
jgi:hypothetical protein